MSIYNFSNSINTGKRGEELIKNWLNENPKISRVEDVTEVKRFQNKDIDLIAYDLNGNPMTIEVKNDQYTSGNFFFETMSSIEAGTLGCMYKTEADYIFYLFEVTGELYILDRLKFIKWFETNKNKFIEKEVKNYRRNGKDTYTTQGYIFKKSFLEKDFKAHIKVLL